MDATLVATLFSQLILSRPTRHFLTREQIFLISEDSDAVIKMVLKRRSPHVRHASCSQRVDSDRLFASINLDSRISVPYVLSMEFRVAPFQFVIF